MFLAQEELERYKYGRKKPCSFTAETGLAVPLRPKEALQLYGRKRPCSITTAERGLASAMSDSEGNVSSNAGAGEIDPQDYSDLDEFAAAAADKNDKGMEE